MHPAAWVRVGVRVGARVKVGASFEKGKKGRDAPCSVDWEAVPEECASCCTGINPGLPSVPRPGRPPTGLCRPQPHNKLSSCCICAISSVGHGCRPQPCGGCSPSILALSPSSLPCSSAWRMLLPPPSALAAARIVLRTDRRSRHGGDGARCGAHGRSLRRALLLLAHCMAGRSKRGWDQLNLSASSSREAQAPRKRPLPLPRSCWAPFARTMGCTSLGARP